MGVAEFIMKLAEDPSPYLDVESDISSHGGSSQVKDSLRGSGIAKDPPPVVKGPVEPNNKGGQSSKIEPWSDSDDQ